MSFDKAENRALVLTDQVSVHIVGPIFVLFGAFCLRDELFELLSRHLYESLVELDLLGDCAQADVFRNLNIALLAHRCHEEHKGVLKSLGFG